MELLGKNKLIKLKRKNRGNIKLCQEIDKLISDIESSEWGDAKELKADRKDADCVHNDGFYFFNLNIHRTMILVVFDDKEATVVWAGAHDEYDRIFRGNKNVIAKWLRAKKLI